LYHYAPADLKQLLSWRRMHAIYGLINADFTTVFLEPDVVFTKVGAVHVASSSRIACENRSAYRVKPFYLSSETVLPVE
jgi:hypothetical protein